ncbi:hypothetical protein BU23DRAFT_19015 [Bimuria novae-zelandiae CBS 107.79]|uniref:Secreted protein n=1 Tax=Bimuria novae-zelandiae CBS 107.79 TaxID=1447943 RepID=A0A6A5UP77_9PLEO|nr:hypothetical protein BU23DRAFT_19015 [Bimuria novae-zelandiae CBS 107.79]
MRATTQFGKSQHVPLLWQCIVWLACCGFLASVQPRFCENSNIVLNLPPSATSCLLRSLRTPLYRPTFTSQEVRLRRRLKPAAATTATAAAEHPEAATPHATNRD